MPQYLRKQKIQRLRGGFKRALSKENYNKLVHFVLIEKLLKPCPGDYVCYRYYKTCMGVATSEPDINEWLELHDSAPRPTVNTKYGRKGKVLEQCLQNGYSKFGTVDGVMQNSEQLQDEIMRCLKAGETLSSISRKLGCTVPNVHYHRRKYKERMAKQLEVDNT